MSDNVCSYYWGRETKEFKTNVCPYYWGGRINAHVGERLLKGFKMSLPLGANSIRIFMGSDANKVYEEIDVPIKDITLTEMAGFTSFAEIFESKQYDTYVITGYDFTTAPAGSFWDKLYLDLDFVNTHVQDIKKEWIDFSQHLADKYPTKKFIMCTWEGDNDCWNGSAWDIKPSTFPKGPKQVEAYMRWIEIRSEAIRESGAPNVFSSVEMTSLRLTQEGYPTVLNYLIANKPQLDYLSFSFWEAKKDKKTLSDAIDYIQKQLLDAYKTNPPVLFIGEFGFKKADWKGKEADKLKEAIEVFNEKKLPYAFVWNLFPMVGGDGPNDFGSMDENGKLLPCGKVYAKQI